MAESPVALLRTHARFAPWNARGLAAHVAGLVDVVGVKPTNASARAAPSARAVRFYVAHKLLEPPVGAGTSATYTYRHFLQLLAIKMRQREGANLETIRREMKDTTGDALERKVALWLSGALLTDTPRTAAVDGADISWRRVQVADGVELHVRHGSVAAGEDAMRSLRESVRVALGRLEAP